MIKKIQLRGISRTPSDRMTADGGCAESLNVHLDAQELAPTLPPKDVTDAVDGEGNRLYPGQQYAVPWEVVFIHKTPFYEKAIIKVTQGTTVKLGTVTGDGDVQSFITLEQTETFERCQSLGNALGVVTSENVYWLVFREGSYQLLGNEIPFPKFAFFNIEQEEQAADQNGNGAVVRSFTYHHNFHPIPYWHTERSEGYEVTTDFPTAFPELWDKIQEAIATNLKSGVLNMQQVAILAIKLYDDTMLISAPFVLSPGFENPFDVHMSYSGHDEGDAPAGDEQYDVTFKTAYKIGLRINETSTFFDDWKDIVTEVRVYLSQQVGAAMPQNKAKLLNYTYSKTWVPPVEDPEYPEPGYWEYETSSDVVLDYDYDYKPDYLTGSFYLAAKYEISPVNMEKLTEGLALNLSELLPSDEEPGKTYNDQLAVQPALFSISNSTDMKNYSVVYRRAVQYNNRIIASDISDRVELPIYNMGLAFNYQSNLNLGNTRFVPLPGYNDWSGPGYNLFRAIVLRATFHLRDAAGREFTVQASDQGEIGKEWYGGIWGSGPDFHDTIRDCVRYAYGFLVCPDARAYAVTLEFAMRTYNGVPTETEVQKVTLELTPHPFINCAYYYGGMDVPLSECETLEITDHFETYPLSHVDDIPNKLYISELDNPFVFPISSRFTFSGKIQGSAIATNALSPGQFGQFPLYVFTTDGIWSMETRSDGTFLAPKPGPRDVCINPDSITSIDNAVVFVTDKGLLLISGAEVTNLSPNMNGRHFALDPQSSEYALISGGSWGSLAPILEDSTTFMAFMKEAEIAYDYIGERLICINSSESYAYVYMLKTATWHKIPMNMRSVNILNSYPDCLVFAEPRLDVEREYSINTISSYEVWDDVTEILCDNHIYDNPEDAHAALGSLPLVFTLSAGTPEDVALIRDLETYMYQHGGFTFTYRLIDHPKVLNFSTVIDDAALLSDTADPVKGIIITRPFDLEEPDVRKTIKDIRIRGQFNRNDVRYILLGSFDDIHWQRLTSLRGGSYKLFRMIILTNLSPTERISWVDVDYESRFTNKLR